MQISNDRPTVESTNGGSTTMAGLTVPSWDPVAARLIGTVLLEAIVLYVGYAGLERLVGPAILNALVGGDGVGSE
nr:hypothetical protein [Halopenitus malekzadehii]